MGERQRGLIRSRLFRALAVSKGDAAVWTAALGLFVGQGQAVAALQKVTATPPLPITFLGSGFDLQIVQDLAACGPIKLYGQGLLCASRYPRKCYHTQF